MELANANDVAALQGGFDVYDDCKTKSKIDKNDKSNHQVHLSQKIQTTA
jgi:hypothetical protein